MNNAENWLNETEKAVDSGRLTAKEVGDAINFMRRYWEDYPETFEDYEEEPDGWDHTFTREDINYLTNAQVEWFGPDSLADVDLLLAGDVVRPVIVDRQGSYDEGGEKITITFTVGTDQFFQFQSWYYSYDGYDREEDVEVYEVVPEKQVVTVYKRKKGK